jgi:c(7)-type cytochrome triheme protein
MRCTVAVLGFLLLAGSLARAYGDDILGDITLPRKGPAASLSFMPQAVFPHWKHRTRFRCFVCHDSLFQMKTGADDIDMDAVRSGRFCGKCHNGKIAFHVGFDTCEQCHRAKNSGS